MNPSNPILRKKDDLMLEKKWNITHELFLQKDFQIQDLQ